MKKILNLMLVLLLVVTSFAFTKIDAAAVTEHDDGNVEIISSSVASDVGFIVDDLTEVYLDHASGTSYTTNMYKDEDDPSVLFVYLYDYQDETTAGLDEAYFKIQYDGEIIYSITDNDVVTAATMYYKITNIGAADAEIKLGLGGDLNIDSYIQWLETTNSFTLVNPYAHNLDYSSEWLIVYDKQVVSGEDLEVSITFTAGGSGIEKFYEAYFVNSASNEIDVAGGIEPANGEYAVINETVTFTINTSGQAAGTYNFQISRLDIEYQGADETMYPSSTIGDLSYEVVSPPTLTLTGDATMYVEYGDTFTDPGATASDSEDGDLTASITTSGTVDDATLGTYTITYSVVDSSGLTVEVDRTVIVRDTSKPIITLTGAANIDVFMDSTYTDSGATASDNYDGVLTGTIVTSGTVDTSIGGTYYITFNVTDTNGNVATTVTRTINVVDTAAPIITITGAETIYVEFGDDYTELGATADDETDGNITANIVTSGVVNENVIGSYTVFYNVTDSSDNDAIQKSRIVIVQDTTVPIIQLEGDAIVYVEVGTSYTELGVVAVDNYNGDISDSVEITGTVDITTLGTYELAYDISDSTGNAAETITRSVVVRDTVKPTISVNDVSTYNSSVDLLAVLLTPTASDIYDGSITEDITVTLDEYTGNETRIGEYDVTYQVIDSSGNTATKTITITVIDDEAPILIGTDDFIDRATYISMDQEDMMNYINGTYIPGDMLGDEMILINDLEEPFAIENITALLSATDDLDGTITEDIVLSVDNYTGNETTLGEYLVYYAVTDSGSQTTQRIVTIINVDVISPNITYNEEALTVAKDGTLVLSDLELVAMDAVDGDITNQMVIAGWDQIDLEVIGTYDVTIEVIDSSGNVSTLVLTVNVVDNVAPTITGPEVFVKHPDYIFTADLILDYYTAADNVDGDITELIKMVSNDLLGHSNIEGTYDLVLQIEDSAGNIVLKSVQIIVDADITPLLIVDSTIFLIDTDDLLSDQDFVDTLILIDDIPEKTYVIDVIQDTYTENSETPGSYDFDFDLSSTDGNSYSKLLDIVVVDHEVEVTPSTPAVITNPDGEPIQIFGYAWYYWGAGLAVLALVFGTKKGRKAVGLK